MRPKVGVCLFRFAGFSKGSEFGKARFFGKILPAGVEIFAKTGCLTLPCRNTFYLCPANGIEQYSAFSVTNREEQK
jgi:hypothetical protein